MDIHSILAILPPDLPLPAGINERDLIHMYDLILKNMVDRVSAEELKEMEEFLDKYRTIYLLLDKKATVEGGQILYNRSSDYWNMQND
jgi:RNA binding exosome subunit